MGSRASWTSPWRTKRPRSARRRPPCGSGLPIPRRAARICANRRSRAPAPVYDHPSAAVEVRGKRTSRRRVSTAAHHDEGTERDPPSTPAGHRLELQPPVASARFSNSCARRSRAGRRAEPGRVLAPMWRGARPPSRAPAPARKAARGSSGRASAPPSGRRGEVDVQALEVVRPETTRRRLDDSEGSAGAARAVPGCDRRSAREASSFHVPSPTSIAPPHALRRGRTGAGIERIPLPSGARYGIQRQRRWPTQTVALEPGGEAPLGLVHGARDAVEPGRDVDDRRPAESLVTLPARRLGEREMDLHLGAAVAEAARLLGHGRRHLALVDRRS